MTSNNKFSDTVYRSDRYLAEMFRLLPPRIGQPVDVLYHATPYEWASDVENDERLHVGNWRMCRAKFTHFSVSWESGRSRPDYIVFTVDEATNYGYDFDKKEWLKIKDGFNTDFFLGGYSVRSGLWMHSQPLTSVMLKLRFEQPNTRWDCPGRTTVTFGSPTARPLVREPFAMS